MVVAGCVGGALWALIPGVLRAYFKTNEIITSLMLNYVAAYLLTYLIFETESYWRDTTGFNATVFPTGKQLPPSAIWPSWTIDVQGGITIPLGLLIGIGIAAGLWFLYQRTRFGFEVQVLSDSERAARYGGVRVRRTILVVMAISGAIAGLGGAAQVGNVAHGLDGDPNGLQKLGYGYTGIVGNIQDLAITTSMGTIYDRSHEHLGVSDSMIIRTRRCLLNAAKAFAETGVTPPGVEQPDLYLRRSATAVLPRETDWLEGTAEMRKPFRERQASAPAIATTSD